MKISCILFFLFSIISTGYGQKNIPWKVSSPEAQGMNSLTLMDGINKLKKNGTNIHSLLVIRNNHIVLDAWFYPFQNSYVHDIASVTKSITSLLIGIAIEKGFIKNEDEQVQDQPDWIEFMLKLPFSAEPGEKFSYCSGNFYLLAEILQRTTKMKCHEFARKYLIDLLQFRKTYWEENSKGVNHGWGDLHTHPYDLAKIASLILNDGSWNEKQVISREWLKKIKPLYYIHGTESYGYGWWLDSENPDEIQALGRGGQRVFILKDKNTVIVATGGGFDAGDIDNLVLESIESFNKNDIHRAELKNLIKSIQSPDTKRIDGNGFSPGMLNKTFQLEENDLDWNSFRFEKRNKEYYIVIDFEDGAKEVHPMGMGNQYKISNEHEFGLPVAIKSFWQENKLIVDYNELSRINLYRFTFGFKGNDVDINFQDLTRKQNVLLKGKSGHRSSNQPVSN